MAASSDSDNKKSRKDGELGTKEESKSDAGAGSGGEVGAAGAASPHAAGGTGGAQNGASGTPQPAASSAATGAAAAAAAAAATAGAASGKERDYIWTEDAVHVLLDHFLEKYMSYEKGMIRNADWVEIAQRVNQQLDGNKPVKTPEQCKNKVDNLKKQYRKERRRGSLGPTSTNWAFFSRMHDIFESDYKKTGGDGAAAAAAAAAAASASAAPDEIPPTNANNSHTSNMTMTNANNNEDLPHRVRSDHHYLASREFLRKQQEELMYKRSHQSRRSETPPPVSHHSSIQHQQQQQQQQHHHHHQQQQQQLMLLDMPPHFPPSNHHHHHRDHHRDSSSVPARKKAKSDSRHHGGGGDTVTVSHGVAQRHHDAPQQHHRHLPQQHAEGSGPPSSDSGGPPGGTAAAAAEGSSKYERKLHRHQLAALRRDFMEGFTGFAEVMLKIEVAKMEMQRDLERQRAEMELHRTQMMLSNQLQLAKYLKSSPISAAGPVPPDGAAAAAAGPASSFWPNFGFTDGINNSNNATNNTNSSSNNSNRLQLAIPIFPDFTALDAVGPYEVLHLLPNVEVLFVSHQPGLYAAGMGMLTLQATASFDQVTRPQILVVPGGMGTRRLLQDRVILDWIRKVHEHTMYTTSVCTGSLLLGAAGLLKGIEATTHWNSHELLAEYGAKPVSSRIVRQGKIITAAGVSAGIDMALQLAALLSDEATAKTLQLYIEYDPQPPFDSGSVSKAGPEVVGRAKELGAKRIAHLQAGARTPS